jgi:hypothetical protein
MPPWNDSIMHHYHFTVYALDIETLGFDGALTGVDALAAMKDHVLAKGMHLGTYTLNTALQAKLDVSTKGQRSFYHFGSRERSISTAQ